VPIGLGDLSNIAIGDVTRRCLAIGDEDDARVTPQRHHGRGVWAEASISSHDWGNVQLLK
jgi:hypothetical protein